MKTDVIRKCTTKQMCKSVAATVLCGLIVVWACIVKFYVIGDSVTTGIWFCMLTLIISTTVFMGGVLLFAMVSRTYIISHPRYYIAFLSVITITFVAHLFLSILSPLLIAPGMTAMMIVQLSRQKQDAFIFNMVEALMIFWALVMESAMTDGEVFMVISGGVGLYLWLLPSITVINIGAGAVIPIVIRDKTKRLNYLMAGICVMLVSVAIFVLTALIHSERDLVLGNFWLLFISGILPLIVAQIINPIMESAFNLVTDSRLSELTDSRRPLLRRLASEAAGTYNHCLAVANLAETCASAIGEDPYLARAAAYYHDVGKLANPSYFTENQAGYNPHDDILPEVSAEIIRNHTTDGYDLLKAHRLPDEITDVAIEHHGTMPIVAFYERAKMLTDGEVDVDDYSYHGKTPTTKIAGIIMICDGAEAAIRAMDKPDGERVDELLHSIIETRIKLGQFDKCKLSLLDMDIIRKTIINAYGGVFHKRVKYPEDEEK